MGRPEGALKVAPRSAGADPGPMCYAQGGTEPTVTDAHLLLGRIPPHLLAGEVPLANEQARSGVETLAGKLGMTWEACASGILEISAWNQANALRQVTVKRGLDVRDFHLVTFGGSGSLLACRLVDVLDLAGVLVPLDPGNLSAYGLLTVDVRNDYVQTAVARQSRLSVTAVQSVFDDLRSQADAALDREGFAADSRRFVRTADLRYYGQAFEVRVEVPDEAVTPQLFAVVAERFHEEHKVLYGYDFRSDARQEVEWVNLRVTGVGPIRKPGPRTVAAGAGAQTARSGTRAVFFDDWIETAIYDRALLGAGDVVDGPAVMEEFSSTVPLHPGFRATVDDAGNLLIRAHGGGQRVSGYRLTDRGAGRPRARRDRRGLPRRRGAGGGDRDRAHQPLADDPGRPRLPGRYPRPPPAQAHRPFILRARATGGTRLPTGHDAPGDVFFHNDVYLSEGGIGHLPDLCVTAPVFHDAEPARRWWGSCRPSGTTTTSAVRSRIDAEPRHQCVRGGPDGPPDQAVGRGGAVRAGAEDHDTQLPDARVARGGPGRRVLRLPDGRPPAGGAFDRYGRPRSRRASTPILDKTTATYRRESWPGSRRARTPGRTTPSTTGSTSRGCTPSASP